ncbi:uncharacterized protein E5676_scaffold195G001160 [Cucumis melo var. makuwa]|uniref:Envelope-like protein n=1 Tax=Cucumis melo var. makuwa TaxID=1194695 RepID=A0A5D3DG47_CUCMM|nr:uncharacterized protein E5676_scaffold195G001160 [Cucumis melo var. makuwa]
MVNTRKGSCQARSSKDDDEAHDSRTNMYGVRMRGLRFKSTPTRRLYRLSSKKSQVNPSDSSTLSMYDENIASSVAENVEMLLRKGLFSTTEPNVVDVPVKSIHSDESSSSEDIFVPTPSQSATANEKLDNLVILHQLDTINENPDINADNHVEPTYNSAPDNVILDVHASQTESKQPPAESRSKE